MINLIKHELKLKSKFSIVALSIYLIEHMYVALKFADNPKEEIVGAIAVNTMFSTLILIGVTFMHSLRDYNNHLRANPGYMMFMANISRRSFIGVKLGTIFTETFLIGLLALTSFLIQFFGFGIHELINSASINIELSHFDGNLVDGLIRAIRVIFFFSTSYLSIISIFLFAITLKTLILKGRKFGGMFAFVIVMFIFFIRDLLIKIFGIELMGTMGKAGRHFGEISRIGTSRVIFQIIFTLVIITGIIYIIEKKLDI